MIRDELINLVEMAIEGRQSKDTEASPNLVKVSKEQNLSAFLYYVYKNNDYKKYFTASLLKNSFYDEDINNLIEAFNKNKIHHVIIKGFLIKKYYPHSALRVMGDIDILLFKEDYKKACSLIQTLGFYEHDKEAEHHREFSNSRITVELHNKLIPKNEVFNGLNFKDWQKHVELIDNYTYKLEDTYHFLFVIAHYIKHLKCGTGIRPLIDLYLLYTKTNINEEWLDKKIKDAKLERFFYIIKSSFSVLFNYHFPNPDVQTVNELIDFSIENWMNARNPNIDSSENIVSFYGNKNKFVVILKRIFPSIHQLKTVMPFTKIKILIPLGYFLNFFRLLFTRFNRGIKLFRKQDKNSIYRKVGI